MAESKIFYICRGWGLWENWFQYASVRWEKGWAMTDDELIYVKINLAHK